MAVLRYTPSFLDNPALFTYYEYMEQNPEDVTTNQNITSETSTVTHPSQPVSKLEISPKNLLLGLLLLLATGAAGYLLGSKKTQPIPPVAAPTPIVAEKPILTETLPAAPDQSADGVTYHDSECGVTFTLPDKQAPYYPYDPNREPSVTSIIGSGSYWQAPRGGISPSLMILANAPTELEVKKQANALFTTDNSGSGYIAAAVSVTCQENSGLATTKDIPSAVESGIVAYNDPSFFKGMGPEKYEEPTIQLMQKWERPVYYFLLNDTEEYYAFIHKDMFYVVQSLGDEKDPVIIKQRTKILDSLKFD